MAFRVGTALYKIYLKPSVKHSEDIDLVQIKAKPIGTIIDKLKEIFYFFDIKPKIKIKANNNNVIFRFYSENEPIIPLKIKINCREHLYILGFVEHKLEINNRWLSVSA